MSDYSKQVNALREHADLIETSGIELYGPSATRLLVYDLRNAAAAIEELDAEETRLLLLTSDLQDKLMDLQEQLNDSDVAAEDDRRQIEELQAEVQILKVSGREAYFEGLAANAEPKRGEWIHSVSVQGTTSGGITYYHGYTCSVCGGLMGRKGDAYCYKCGAKMEVQDG